jgi:hypothetical protein
LFKIRKILPIAYYRILDSYLTDRRFQVKFKDKITTLRKTEAGVPRRSILGPVLYLIYTSDLPTSDNITTATFANDTAILATNEDPAIDSMKPQTTINKVDDWAKKWKINIDQSKSKHISLILRNQTCPTVQWAMFIYPRKMK